MGRHCKADGEGGYTFDCITTCPPASPGDEVCAEDYGVYPSECHMHKETCEMYGVDIHVKKVDDHTFCTKVNHPGGKYLLID